MPWEAWFTLALIALALLAMVRNWAGPDLALLGALAVVTAVGAASGSPRLPSPPEMVAGFGHPAPITVGVLFIVVEGLVRTGAMMRISVPLMGLPRSAREGQLRLMPPVAGLSAFLNNTPVVAMFMPVVDDWCRKSGIAASKLMIPLSYASILGGTCTLIGTSTNLIIAGLVLTQPQLPQLGLFDIAWLGVPCAVVGIGFIILLGPRLLPDRSRGIDAAADPRQYTVEMIVEPDGPLVGKTIEQAGLRHLQGLYLAEVDRDDQIIAAVGPQQRLATGDRLVFVGVVDSVVELQRIRGLRPATKQVFKLDTARDQRSLIEAVVSSECPLVGQSIREGGFRSVYEAAVIAVARRGERLRAKIGDIVLQPGDVLLLEGAPAVVQRLRNTRDFYLVSAVGDSAPRRHERAWIALGILGAMVAVVGLGLLDILTGAMLAAGAMVLTRCCRASEARRSIHWQVLLVIGAALGLGQALSESGAAEALAGGLIHLVGTHPWLLLVVIYLVTVLFTEMVTNNAAAVLIFPIALAGAHGIDADPMPYIMTLMIAASASFITPIGYQTNLMVYGAGGYRFGDYLRLGLPLSALVCLLTVTLAPLLWPFDP